MNVATRFSPSDIERARSVDLVALIAGSVKLIRRGRTWWGRCPFHADNTPSFKVENERRAYYCFGCGARGDAIDWIVVTEGLSFPEAMLKLTGGESTDQGERNRRSERRHHSPVSIPPPSTEPNPKALRIWIGAQSIAGTLGETYLREHRGITSPLPPSIRFTRTIYEKTGTELPCVVAAVQRPDRRVVAVQATFLDERGAKALLSPPRWTYGALGTGAVRLGLAGEVLGVAEGTEKGLAAMQLSGVPCWATLGAHRLANITIPDTVRELHVFCDNDQAGRNAAERTSERHTREGRRVLLRFPPEHCKDWDDFLRALAGQAAG